MELFCTPQVAAMLQTLIGVDWKHPVGMYSIMLKRRRRRELFLAPRVAAMLQTLMGVDRKHHEGMYSIVMKRRRRKEDFFLCT